MIKLKQNDKLFINLLLFLYGLHKITSKYELSFEILVFKNVFLY
jgi:hypothetical protein